MNAIGISVVLLRTDLQPGEKFVPASHIKMFPAHTLILGPPTPNHTFAEDTKAQFWDKPENAKLLEKWKPNEMHPSAAMPMIKVVIGSLLRQFPDHVVVMDCASDVFWTDYYLVEYGNSNPLHMFDGKYEGGPFNTDDEYRGFLGTNDLWGLDDKIDQLTGFVPKIDGTPHDPGYDASVIGTRYALYLGLLKKPREIVKV
jgi:hypothetical protein